METYKLANRSDYIEGEAEAQDLIYTLSDEITSAVISNEDGTTVPSKWEEVFRSEGSLHVEYEKKNTNAVGKYKHTDEKLYDIFKLEVSGEGAEFITADYKFIEVENIAPAGDTSRPTGESLELSFDFTYTDPNGAEKMINTYLTPESGAEALFAFIPNEQSTYGYDTHLIVQGFYDEDGTFIYSKEWDYFESVGVIPHDDLSYWANKTNNYRIYFRKATAYQGGNDITKFIDFNEVYKPYNFSKLSYVAKPVIQVPNVVVLKSIPDTPTGISPREYYVMLEQKLDEFNYFDISYGVGFSVDSEATGDAGLTYLDICDPATVKGEGSIPKVIDQLKCHLYVRSTVDSETSVYEPPKLSWELDWDGTKEMRSPVSHFFYGRDSTTHWVVNKKRRPDYLVRYFLSINNNRVALVIEGDPSPSIMDYYRAFGYIGKISPFNQYDHIGNFGVTVGMGELDINKTGFVEADIKEDTPEYGWWGEYTSNGMWSMSMFNTRSNVFFQAHHPAFLTQLPNYEEVGSIPPALKRLVLDDDRFQPSIWTSNYHGSPIYLVHRSEGYRGFMDGVVVVEDHNIVNGDELIVDTHILKDSSDPSKGTWTEVYKFFSCNAPVNLFAKYSPAPGKVSVALLKEIR